MTISYKLGTAMPQEEIFRAARDIGFIERPYPGMPQIRLPEHGSVPGLRMQIHGPNWFHDARGIRTEIELDDRSRQQYRPETMDVLRKLFVRVPDLVYRERWTPPVKSRIISVRELLESI
jgi:hypothetical protein